MLYLCGFEQTLKTLVLACSSQNFRPTNLTELRSAYFHLCRQIGGPLTAPNDLNDSMFCFDEGRIASLVKKYHEDSTLNDLSTDTQETTDSSRRAAYNVINDGLTQLARLQPELRRLFDLYIHTLFYQRSLHSGGGSVSSSPGVIWLAIRRHWSAEDIIEVLVHEFSHNELFLDERVHKHYVDLGRLASKETFAVYAILKIRRPLDKVIHSLVVAHEVLSFRAATMEPIAPRVHPASWDLIKAVEVSLDSVKVVLGAYDLVTVRVHEIISGIEARMPILKKTVAYEQQVA